LVGKENARTVPREGILDAENDRSALATVGRKKDAKKNFGPFDYNGRKGEAPDDRGLEGDIDMEKRKRQKSRGVDVDGGTEAGKQPSNKAEPSARAGAPSKPLLAASNGARG